MGDLIRVSVPTPCIGKIYRGCCVFIFSQRVPRKWGSLQRTVIMAKKMRVSVLAIILYYTPSLRKECERYNNRNLIKRVIFNNSDYTLLSERLRRRLAPLFHNTVFLQIALFFWSGFYSGLGFIFYADWLQIQTSWLFLQKNSITPSSEFCVFYKIVKSYKHFKAV